MALEDVGLMIGMALQLAILGLTIAGMWKVFEKADKPGWAAIIPFYNAYVLIKVAGRPGWWVLLYFVPVISLIPALIVPFEIGKRFGKGAGYGLGLIFLPFVFFPHLGLVDDAPYQLKTE